MPRDFLSDEITTEEPDKLPGRDFLNEDEESKEGYASKIPKAINTLIGDAAHGGMNAIKSVPGYYESAKTEIPGALKTLINNPSHAGKQALAGLTELGHNTLNYPHDISEYVSNRLNLIPQSFADKVPYQKDISEDINSLFGEQKYPGDALLRGVPRNLTNILGAGKLFSLANPLKLTNKSISKDVVKTGEKNQKVYSKLYDNLFEEAHDKGYGDMSFVKPNIDLNTIEEFTPNKKIVGLKDFNETPNIENAHRAKSDLLKVQRDLNKKSFLNEGEKKQYTAVNNAINNLQQNMFKDSKGIVNNSLLDKYGKIQKGYSQEVVPYKLPIFGKYKRKEISPKKFVNALSEGEFMQKRGSSHPRIAIKNKISPTLKGAGALSIANYVYNKLGDNENNR